MTIFTLVKIVLLFLLGYVPLVIATYYELLLRRCARVGNAYFYFFYMRLISEIYCYLFVIYFFQYGISSYINIIIQQQNTIDYTYYQPTLTIQQPPQNEDVVQTVNTDEIEQLIHEKLIDSFSVVEEWKNNVSFFFIFIDHAY